MASEREEHPQTTLVKKLMVKHGLFQSDIARELGVTQPNINKGVNTPTSKTFTKIVELFINKYGEDADLFAMNVVEEARKRDKSTGKTLATLLKITAETSQQIGKIAQTMDQVKKDVEILKTNYETLQRALDVQQEKE